MNVAIIGTGRVGATLAFCLANNKKIDKLFLINRSKETVQGLKYDLMGTFPERGGSIIIGDYKNANDADIIVITCGVSGAPSGTQLFDTNKKIVENILTEIKPKKSTKIIVISTPVDEIAKIVYELSGLDKKQIIGFGGQLDVNRLKYLIYKNNDNFSTKIKVNFVGVHGAQGVPLFDEALIRNKDQITETSKNYYKKYLAESKFSTFSVASELAKLVNSLMTDKENILTVSYYDEKNGLFVTWPCIINKNGVKRPVKIELTETEKIELDELIKKRKTSFR